MRCDCCGKEILGDKSTSIYYAFGIKENSYTIEQQDNHFSRTTTETSSTIITMQGKNHGTVCSNCKMKGTLRILLSNFIFTMIVLAIGLATIYLAGLIKDDSLTVVQWIVYILGGIISIYSTTIILGINGENYKGACYSIHYKRTTPKLNKGNNFSYRPLTNNAELEKYVLISTDIENWDSTVY